MDWMQIAIGAVIGAIIVSYIWYRANEDDKEHQRNIRKATLCYVKNLESQLAESKKQVQELVEMAEQAMRQWKMYMTDFQRDDLDELLKNPANAEAHIYKRLEVSLSKHKLKGKLNEPSS